MSVTNYSKWDKIELSDDEDVECHPNIDKASWVRMMQRKIHQEREDRRQKIAQMKAELTTNTQLRLKILEWQETLKKSDNRQHVESLLKNMDAFEKERKPKLLDKDSEEFMQIKDIDEVVYMLFDRLLKENKVDHRTDLVIDKLPAILIDELPKLDKRQSTLLEDIKKEEKEQTKKLTSENISHEGFSKTIINPKAAASKSQKSATTKAKEQNIEVLNAHQSVVTENKDSKKEAARNEDGLRELSLSEEKMLLEFIKNKDFEDSYKFIQKHPEIVDREFSDHLMARAFKKQMEGQDKEAFACVKWSLCISYCLQMGVDGTGLFFQRMTKAGPQAVAMFEQDVQGTYAHVQKRAKVLLEKKSEKEVDDSNSNLTPEQAVAFKTFPRHFQDALYSGAMDKINESFAKMTKEEADRVMADCQKTGLISVVSDEQAKELLKEQE